MTRHYLIESGLSVMRDVTVAFALCVALGHASMAQAQGQSAVSYPAKPVRLILGFAPGTGPDIIARTLAQRLSQVWGNVAVVVDNKPGAAGLIAAAEASRAAPDGYTLMLGELGQMSIAPHVNSKLPYNPQKDFVAVSQVTNAGFVLLIDPKQVPARNVREFVEWSRKQPKGIFMGTFGPGTPGHFAAYMFSDAAKIKMEAVHYKTTADAIVGLSSGDLQGAFVSVSLAMAQMKGGKLIGLGNTAAVRSASLSDLPTLKEQGYAALELTAWSGIVAPAKTPPDIVSKLSADITTALSAETRAKLEEMGITVTGTTAQEFARIIAADSVTWGKAITAMGFKAE